MTYKGWYAINPTNQNYLILYYTWNLLTVCKQMIDS